MGADAPDLASVPDDLLHAYRTMHKMTEQPHSVSTQFSALCGMNPASIAAMKREGPHYATWINVYMNEKAQTHFEAGPKTAFPPGSIVVKEKLYFHHNPTQFTKDNVPVVEAVTGLVKHPAGYDPRTGDWEFFYFEKDGPIERGAKGKLAACADCHHDAPTDYVFGDFTKPTAAAR